MRALARQSTRLATIRQTSRSRACLANELARNFTRTAYQANESRGPNGNPDHEARVEERKEQEEVKNRENELPASGKETEQGDAKSSNNANRKLGVGKTRRQRLEDQANVPKPPPIPSWFLNHNVKLQVESAAPNRSAKNAQVLRCVDRETGHTLFLLPWYEAWPVPGAEKSSSAGKKKAIDRSFFDSKILSQPTTTPTPKSRAVPILSPPAKDDVEDPTPHNLLRWALLEAETGIRAGFTAAARAQPASSHAASKVDISLLSDPDTHDQLDDLVEDLTALTQADIIRLDANDLSDLTAEYVGKGSDVPGSFSALGYDVFDGYTSASNRPGRNMEEDEEIDEMEEGEEDEEEVHSSGGFNAGPFNGLDGLRKALFDNRHGLDKALGRINVTGIALGPPRIARLGPSGFGGQLRSMDSSSSEGSKSWDNDKLTALLDTLLDAPKSKRSSPTSQRQNGFRRNLSNLIGNGKQQNADNDLTEDDKADRALWRSWRSSPSFWLPDVAGLLAGHVVRTKDLPLELEGHDGKVSKNADTPQRTIVHVRDLKDICNSQKGDAIVRKLVRVVQKRRRAGEEILIVGTTAQEAVGGTFAPFSQSTDDFPFRTINIPAFFNMSRSEQAQFKLDAAKIEANTNPTHHKILEINSRHLESMLRRLRPEDPIDLFTETSQRQLCLAGSQILSQKVLSLNHVQRLLLTAIGLSQTHAQSTAINASHIGLAALITGQADRNARAWTSFSFGKEERQDAAESKDRLDAANSGVDKSKARIDQLARTCNPHESRLLTGVVDPQNIKTGFGQVHAPPETIESLKTMTSLSLLRPEAFKYGVLAADRLPGLMLYGPPGTGKTLLARAVAKESKATVLEVSGAQIYEKYVGEGEKMVRAVFSLAKKLSPCIVFIDEADAIFGSRGNAGNKNTHREIINQFLREWDGMEMANVFIMVASNRPFDLDDAVLRRLPRRILVDLPIAKDRESILKIHLGEEALDDTVKLAELAEQTPLYSGSDLKNLCVSAALACVREENDLMASKQKEEGGEKFELPEKRTLSGRHFEKAIKEISASISEDMSSLTAIRKFDEQYGERRGRRKKVSYGFGMGGEGEGKVDEGSARVRP